MNRERLSEVVTHLKEALRILQNADVENTKLVALYAEFLVALKLVEMGYEVQIGKEMQICKTLKGKTTKQPDLYIPEDGIRIEGLC